MTLPEIVTALRGNLSAKKFANEIGVSHTSVNGWLRGDNVSPWNRIKLLNFARRTGVKGKLLREIEAVQPQINEARP